MLMRRFCAKCAKPLQRQVRERLHACTPPCFHSLIVTTALNFRKTQMKIYSSYVFCCPQYLLTSALHGKGFLGSQQCPSEHYVWHGHSLIFFTEELHPYGLHEAVYNECGGPRATPFIASLPSSTLKTLWFIIIGGKAREWGRVD